MDLLNLGLQVGIPLLGSIFGGRRRERAARSEAAAQNRALDLKYEYDTQVYENRLKVLERDHAYAAESLAIRKRNDDNIYGYKRTANLQNYYQQLQIRHAQQRKNEAAYAKSDEVFNAKLGLNEMSAAAAIESQYQRLEELEDQAMLDQGDIYLEKLQAEGSLRALGRTGKTADKLTQSTLFQLSRQADLINATFDSEFENTKSLMMEILRDKDAADLSAYANKMLDPGVIPMPLAPLEAPRTVWQDIKPFEEFDKPVAPVRGVPVDPQIAVNRIWGETISGIAGSVGSAIGDYDWSNFNRTTNTGGSTPSNVGSTSNSNTNSNQFNPNIPSDAFPYWNQNTFSGAYDSWNQSIQGTNAFNYWDRR